LVEEVKTNSSARIKEEGLALNDFHWQNGYGVFSVSTCPRTTPCFVLFWGGWCNSIGDRWCGG
jgi:hypothetical protein